MPPLLNPRSVSLKDMVPLWEVVCAVRGWPEERWHEAFSHSTAPLQASDPDWAQTLSCQMRHLDRADDLAVARLWLALRQGALTAYVGDPRFGRAVAIRPLMWMFNAFGAESARSIGDGTMYMDLDRISKLTDLTGRTIADFAGHPIYIAKAAVRELFARRRIPEATADKIAKSVIGQFRAEFTRRRMAKDDFIRKVQARDDRIFKAIAIRLWAKHAPEEWKRSGTKSPGSRKSR